MKRGPKRRERETNGKTATENGGRREQAKQRRSEGCIPAAAKPKIGGDKTKTDSLRSEQSETSDYGRELHETSKGPSSHERALGSVSALPTRGRHVATRRCNLLMYNVKIKQQCSEGTANGA